MTDFFMHIIFLRVKMSDMCYMHHTMGQHVRNTDSRCFWCATYALQKYVHKGCIDCVNREQEVFVTLCTT